MEENKKKSIPLIDFGPERRLLNRLQNYLNLRYIPSVFIDSDEIFEKQRKLIQKKINELNILIYDYVDMVAKIRYSEVEIDISNVRFYLEE